MSHIKIDQKSDCWIWIEDVGGIWYKRPKYSGVAASRVSWEIFRGEIPENHDIHHLCKNGECVNPDHLEPKTKEEHKNLHYAPLIL